MAIAGISGTNPITNPTGGSTTAAPTVTKDAFLKLLVAQLTHQDPLAPTGGTEFVTQLSQFATMEQTQSQTQKLDELAAQMRGLSSNESTALIGKSVTIRGHGIAFDGLLATSTDVSLAAPADKVTAIIRDSKGNPVRTLDLGAQPGGAVPINWDGRDSSGQPAPKGQYTVDVTATAANGAPVQVSQDVTGVVKEISFDKGYPQIVLDTGAMAPISDLVSVAAPKVP